MKTICADDIGTVDNVLHHDARRFAPLNALAVDYGTDSGRRGGGRRPVYRPYVPLQEWEAITDALKKEAIPVKRFGLLDYRSERRPSLALVGTTATHTVAASAIEDLASTDSMAPSKHTVVAEASPAQTTSPRLPRRPKSAEGWRAATNAGGEEVMAKPRPPQVSPSPPQPCHPKPPMQHFSVRAHCRLDQAPPQKMSPHCSQSQEVRLGFVGQGSCKAKVQNSLPSGLQEAPASDTPKLNIINVRHNDLTQVATYRVVSASPRQVADRDLARFPDTIRKPIRSKNSELRNRLDEILNLPNSRISAKQQHPARCFHIIPPANLRAV